MMNNLEKCYRHFKTITKHKVEVMKACHYAGLYWRGITHDLSKYSIAEFYAGAMYFQGNRSPIDAEKAEKGYSLSWLHHRGRNPHHWEYWMDNFSSGGRAQKMPYKYCMEMICDWIGAGKVYSNKKWTKAEPEMYITKRLLNHEILLHSHTELFIRAVLSAFSECEWVALDKHATKALYDMYDDGGR